MRRSIRIVGPIIIILIVLSLIEVMAYIESQYLVNYSIGFTPLNITDSYESYSRRYNPRLGWLSPQERVDTSGSRYIPAFMDPKQNRACVTLYGDSFTEGFGVDDEHAWSNVLSLLLHCRVANYGVPGYGTDQAFLRFVDNRQDQARVVILGFLSDNLMRNVNQLRNLISDATACALKPRFIVNEQGHLTLVPVPHLTKKQFEDLKDHPERVLKHEFFLPGGQSGFHKQKFPYTWGIIKSFPILFRNMVLHQGTYYSLYQRGHPSKALEVTVAIMEEFCQEAQNRGQQPLVLIMPTHVDLANYRRTGKWVYQPLLDLLAARKIDFLDAGFGFYQYLGNAELETLYDPKTRYHLNEKGNWLLATIVYNYIIRNNFFGTIAHEPPHP